jgi:hypothetical protein
LVLFQRIWSCHLAALFLHLDCVNLCSDVLQPIFFIIILCEIYKFLFCILLLVFSRLLYSILFSTFMHVPKIDFYSKSGKLHKRDWYEIACYTMLHNSDHSCLHIIALLNKNWLLIPQLAQSELQEALTQWMAAE